MFTLFGGPSSLNQTRYTIETIYDEVALRLHGLHNERMSYGFWLFYPNLKLVIGYKLFLDKWSQVTRGHDHSQ